MRKRILPLLIATAISATAVFAQRGFRGMNNGNPPDPATMIERRVNFLKTLLDLTDAQVTQATTIFTNAAAAATPLRTNLQTAHQSLRDAIKSNSTGTIDSLAANIGTLTGQFTAVQSKADAAFYAILTADQKTKFDSVGHGFMGPGGPGRGFGARRQRPE